MRKRIEYIDVVETLAIFFVVCCHNTALLGQSVLATAILQFTTTVAVPLFFMANGALLMSRPLDLKKHLTKTGMLVIAVFAWRLLTWFLVMPFDTKTYSQIGAVNLINYLLGGTTSAYIPVEDYWYMYRLIAIYLFLPIIKLVYNHDSKVFKYLMVIMFVAAFVVTEIDFIFKLASKWYGIGLISVGSFRDKIFPLSLIADSGFYFLAGDFLHRNYYQKEISKKSRIHLAITAVAAYALLLFQKFLQQGTLSGSWQRLDNDYLRIGTLVLASSIYALFANTDFSNQKHLNRYCQFVSVRTMNIYMIHMYLIYVFNRWLVPKTSFRGVGIYLLSTLGIVIVGLLVTEPFTYIGFIRKILGLQPRR